MNHDNKPNAMSARVLLVDDDRRILAALNARLTQMGCQCTTCGNASEAMVQFAGGRFDLVITDLTMPGMDGLSIVGLIRGQSEIPILVVTGHSAEYHHLITGYPNVTVIGKPFESRKLLKCVRSLLAETAGNKIPTKQGQPVVA